VEQFRFIGLFDVVGAFGLGIAGDIRILNIGHHLSLPKNRIGYCFHAMALDETRVSFNVIRLKGAHDVPPVWRPVAQTDRRHYSATARPNCRPLADPCAIEDETAEAIAQT
jgi:hypothetical protein